MGESGGCFLGMQHAVVRGCSFFMGARWVSFQIGKRHIDMEENPAIPENQGCPSRNCTLFPEENV